MKVLRRMWWFCAPCHARGGAGLPGGHILRSSLWKNLRAERAHRVGHVIHCDGREHRVATHRSLFVFPAGL